MAKFRYQHIKSSVEGKAPTAAQIKTAEIGVNDFAGDEKLFIKNSEGEVVDFPRGYSQTVIDENERVTAEALNYLNANKLDASAYTPTDLSNYYTKDETSGKTEIQNALDEKANTATTLAGYGITDAYTKDEIDNTELAIAESLNDLNSRKLDASAYTPTDLSDYYKKSEVDARDLWVSGTGTSSVALKGGNNTASGSYSVAEGSGTTASGVQSHAEGNSTSATSANGHAEGQQTIASNQASHAEGQGTNAIGVASHSEGQGTTASGQSSHAEGAGSRAIGIYSHAEGVGTNASGYSSHAEGQNTTANGSYSHSEGGGTTAFGENSHAEGGGTTASGSCSHTEGGGTRANGYGSHAEGSGSQAIGPNSHAEGGGTQANGAQSHAEGGGTQAIGSQSHAEGGGTIANNYCEHASGTFNLSSSASTTFGDSGNTLFSVGNGTYNARHNAFEIRQNGDIYFTSGNTDVKLQDSIPSVDGYADSVKYNSTTHYVEFYHGTTAGTKVFEYDASPFLIDGMVEDVEIEDVEISGETVTCLVISFNTAAGKQDINIPLSDIFDPSNYYTKSETSGATEIQNALDEKSDTGHTHDDRYYTEIEIDNLLAGKVSTSDIDQVIDDTTSASTGAVSTSAVYGFVTSYTPSITVDQVLDDTTSASTNPVSSKAVYKAVTDNELVWTNAFVTLSSITSAHTANTEIHVTAADKDNWDAKLDASAYTPTDLSNYYTKTEVDARDLWVSGTGENAIVQKGGNNTASGDYSVAEGSGTIASGESSHAEGESTSATNVDSHAEGYATLASGNSSHAEGWGTVSLNKAEHASGLYNVSSYSSDTFGDSGNTLFSVGNGTADDARHNAFEIRQNGDIYITSGNTNIKLQDSLGSTIDKTIDSTTSASTNAVSTSAVYTQMDGIKLKKITQSAYDALVQAGTVDANTLYFITD